MEFNGNNSCTYSCQQNTTKIVIIAQETNRYVCIGHTCNKGKNLVKKLSTTSDGAFG